MNEPFLTSHVYELNNLTIYLLLHQTLYASLLITIN